MGVCDTETVWAKVEVGVLDTGLGVGVTDWEAVAVGVEGVSDRLPVRGLGLGLGLRVSELPVGVGLRADGLIEAEGDTLRDSVEAVPDAVRVRDDCV